MIDAPTTTVSNGRRRVADPEGQVRGITEGQQPDDPHGKALNEEKPAIGVRQLARVPAWPSLRSPSPYAPTVSGPATRPHDDQPEHQLGLTTSGVFERTTCSTIPMPSDAEKAMGRLCQSADPPHQRVRRGAARGPSASTETVPWVGHTRDAENAAMAPATAHDSVPIRAAVTPASDAASGLSAAARIAMP